MEDEYGVVGSGKGVGGGGTVLLFWFSNVCVLHCNSAGAAGTTAVWSK